MASRLRGKRTTKKDYGFIAEEVGKELPIIVEWDNKNSAGETPSALSMDYTRIIPILLEGIKSQQNQIDQLKDEINILKQGTEPTRSLFILLAGRLIPPVIFRLYMEEIKICLVLYSK